MLTPYCVLRMKKYLDKPTFAALLAADAYDLRDAPRPSLPVRGLVEFGETVSERVYDLAACARGLPRYAVLPPDREAVFRDLLTAGFYPTRAPIWQRRDEVVGVWFLDEGQSLTAFVRERVSFPVARWSYDGETYVCHDPARQGLACVDEASFRAHLDDPLGPASLEGVVRYLLQLRDLREFHVLDAGQRARVREWTWRLRT